MKRSLFDREQYGKDMGSDALRNLFLTTRERTETICSFLEVEDYVVQPVEFVSPPKWHLAHSTWFFEEFVLKEYKKGYVPFHRDYGYIFNSYYESVGEKVARNHRGKLSRPTVLEIYRYRNQVTEAMLDLLEKEWDQGLHHLVLTGIHHEKQHQELLLTDIKFILGTNPLRPPYNGEVDENAVQGSSPGWHKVTEGIYKIGHWNLSEFCYDNELKSHKVFLGEYSIAKGLVTNREYLEFMASGGYDNVLLWHSEGWEWKNQQQIKSPLYWVDLDGQWHQYTLRGLEKVRLDAPVTHISFYEASAFSEWKEARLPTEFEWEAAQASIPWGKRWEWTASAYLPYPGYEKEAGAIGEYNGKFMVNQMVLRGASIATPPDHIRPTYRNFFPPDTRWQYSGIRLVTKNRS